MRKYSIGILQTHATQFDGPLFKVLSANEQIDLTVYYSRSEEERNAYDPELDREVEWDHSVHEGYTKDSAGSGFLAKCYQIQQIIKARHDLLIVAGYSSVMSFVTSLAARAFGIPVGLRLDSVLIYDKSTSWKRRAKEIILPFIFKYIYTTGHATGTLAKEYLLHFGFKREAIFLYPYNVDNDYLQAALADSPAKQSELRQTFDINPQDLAVLGVLKFVPREDPVTLLLGFADMAQNTSRCHLILVGDGALRSELEKIVLKNNISNVHFVGYVPYSHLPWYYGIANIFVHPARVEQWGVSVNEAMACSVPVIVADTVGSHPDLIIPGKTGLIFRAGNPQSLGKCLGELIGSSSMRAEFAKEGRQLINNWSFTQTEKQILKALNYVVHR